MPVSKKDITDTWVDPDDAPELTDEWFKAASLYDGEKLIRRGRPAGTALKSQVTLRLDKDVLAAFRSGGRGWQSRINAALKEWLRANNPLSS